MDTDPCILTVTVILSATKLGGRRLHNPGRLATLHSTQAVETTAVNLGIWLFSYYHTDYMFCKIFTITL